MRYERAVVFDSVDGTLTQYSKPIDATNLFAASAQVVATGTCAGTLKLQFSNDDSQSIAGNPVNWINISSAQVAISAGATTGIAKIDLSYQYIRAVFTPISGSGTITAVVSAKGF